MQRRSFLVSAIAIGMVLGLAVLPARACVWDSDTLAQEQRHSPKLAEVILGKTAPAVDTAKLGERISRLRAERREDDPAWWNDLAGAHIRLGEPQQAVELLEPAAKRFPNDYGVHANLGTAYHLVGRYREAEREIARDLEINPNAHFDLERYHLALLQYLVRDRGYQSRHVYVDEWSQYLHNLGPDYGYVPTLPGKISPDDPWRGIDRVRQEAMLSWTYIGSPSPTASTGTAAPGRAGSDPNSTRGLSAEELSRQVGRDLVRAGVLKGTARERLVRSIQARMTVKPEEIEMLLDAPPPYRYRWDLAADAKFEEGVVYLASLNPQQPACFAMLGVAALKRRDLNLAAHAFERAVELKSPQSKLLGDLAEGLRLHIRESQAHGVPSDNQILRFLASLAAGFVLAVGIVIWLGVRWWRRRRLPARALPTVPE